MTTITKKVENNELIKHTASIHISNTLTLVARKVSNILLKNAFYDLGNKNTYSIRIADLVSETGVNSRNYQIIRDSLDVLLNTTIKWNIFGKDNKNDWSDKRFVASKMLASIKYDEVSDYVEYSYSEHLKQLFQNPNIYAKLNLLIQKNFKSKHSLALWEFLVEYICSSGNSDYVVTNWIDIADYRKFLGIAKEEYPEFKAMNKYLIKAPIDEVNEVSDVKTTVEYKKDVRKVVAIRFGIQRQNKQIEGKKNTENSKEEKPIEIKEVFTNYQENPLFTLLTQEYCIAEKSAISLLKKYSDNQIQKSLEYVESCRKSKNPPKNLPAFTMKAIENNWEKKVSSSEKVKISRNVKETRYQFLRDAILSFYLQMVDFAFSQARIEIANLPLNERETLFGRYLQGFSKKNINDDVEFANMLLWNSQFLNDRYQISSFNDVIKNLQNEFKMNKHSLKNIDLFAMWHSSDIPQNVLDNRKNLFEKFASSVDFNIFEYKQEFETLVNDLNSTQNEQIELFVA